MTTTTNNSPPKTKKRLQADWNARYNEVKGLKAKRDSGEITPEEIDSLRAAVAECKAIQDEIDHFPDVEAIDDDLGAMDTWSRRPATTPPPSLGRSVSGGGNHHNGSPANGHAGAVKAIESEHDKYLTAGPFKSLGHFMYCVQKAGPQPGLSGGGSIGDWNYRVQQYDSAVKSAMPEVKAASGMNELYDSEGGALVPPQFSNRVWERVAGDQTNLLNLVDKTPVSGNGYSMAAWNDKSRTGDLLYGGARAYWGQEGAQKTSSAPTTRMITWRLNKLYVLMFATDELLEDTVALEARLASIAAQCFTYKINQAILRGTGSGQPLGLLNSSAKIAATAVSGQGASTIIGSNITAMFSRRPSGSSNRLVWIYNTDIEPQLDALNFTVAGTNSIAAQWMYSPSGGLRDYQEPRLKGRPMVESEHASALGTEGDLILWDPSAYGAIVKSTGIQNAVSMHLRFDYDETAFRWVFRMDGRPFWDDVLTPANGSTKAPIITLSSSRT